MLFSDSPRRRRVDRDTLREAENYALSLIDLQCFKEAKKVMRKTMPVARRVLGGGHDITLMMSSIYAGALYKDGATLDDLREAVTTSEEIQRTARRVFGGTHPLVETIERSLLNARAALAARDVD